MYCSNCGKENPDDGRFCFNCGAQLSSQQINFSDQSPVSIKKNKTPKSPYTIINFILAAIFIIYGIFNFPAGIVTIILAVILILSTLKSNQKEAESINKSEQAIKELENYKATFTPEMVEYSNLVKKIEEMNETVSNLKEQENNLSREVQEQTEKLTTLKNEIIETTEEIQMQEFGLYQPKYDFTSSEIYKNKLDEIRKKQKQLVKENRAVTGNMNWTVNNSSTQGQKMVKDMQKLLLRAFNSECDELIDKVKFNTFETAKKRMESSFTAISKLGNIMRVAITTEYYNSKYEELCLALEYRQKKQEEKEEQKEIRARMREEAKLQKEIEAKRLVAKKEQSHYENALEKINKQLENANESERQALNDKKYEIEHQLSEIQKTIDDIDYRESNIRAGYVYIISNIGSFGENVYKIGMTRRLDPMERIDELGDASVPFNFDVHAMIFSDDAPALEAALHSAFDEKKVNMINKRREFFNVTLEEIEEVVKRNYDKTVEFIKLPEAEQYRESIKIKQNKPSYISA